MSVCVTASASLNVIVLLIPALPSAALYPSVLSGLLSVAVVPSDVSVVVPAASSLIPRVSLGRFSQPLRYVSVTALLPICTVLLPLPVAVADEFRWSAVGMLGAPM